MNEVGARALRRAAVLAASVVVAVALTFTAVAIVLVHTGAGRRVLLRAIARASGYTIAARSISVSPALLIHATEVSVSAGAAEPLFRADDVTVDLSLAALLHGRAQLFEARGFEVAWDRIPSGGGGHRRMPLRELRLIDGRVRAGSLRPDAEIVVRYVAVARETGGERFEIRGELSAPAHGAFVRWDGHADADGKRLEARGRGRIGDLNALLADFTQAGRETSAVDSVALKARLRGDLRGEIVSRMHARLGVGQLKRPARARGELAYDGANRLGVDVGIRVGRVAPARVRGNVALDGSVPRLGIRAIWNGGVEPVAAALTQPPAWLPAGGQGAIRVRLKGTHSLRGAARVAGTGLTMRRGDFVLRSDARGSFRYRRGALRSVPRHLTLRQMQATSPTISAVATRVSGEARITLEPFGVALEGTVVEGLSLQNEQRALQAANVQLMGELAVGLDAAGHAMGDATLRLPRGELLWDRAYVSFADFPLTLTTRYGYDDKKLDLAGTSLAIANVGRIDGAATFDSDLTIRRADARAALPSIARAFEVAIRDPFAEAWPFLSSTSTDGALSAELTYERVGSGSRTTARVSVRNGSLAITAPAVRLGYDAELPLVLASAGAAQTGSAAAGYIRTGDADVGGLRISAVDLPLEARENEITIARPIELPVAQGIIRIEGLRAYELGSGSPRADGKVEVENLDLEALTQAAGMPHVSGTIAGDLGTVTLSRTALETTGGLGIDAFGGHASVTDLGIDDVFSPVPALRLDAEISGLDLRAATETFGVGYISGIGRARIQDLEITAGQPVRFDLEFETVPTRGVPQRVSVAALQQLTILGGAGPDALTRGILVLFDEYRYAKMGLRCSLRNDRFILHGIAEHDGKDFLVVGTTLPPTVNVISHNEVIAFREMVNRLRRIFASGGQSAEEPRHEGE